jgi:hypothetical protein
MMATPVRTDSRLSDYLLGFTVRYRRPSAVYKDGHERRGISFQALELVQPRLRLVIHDFLQPILASRLVLRDSRFSELDGDFPWPLPIARLGVRARLCHVPFHVLRPQHPQLHRVCATLAPFLTDHDFAERHDSERPGWRMRRGDRVERPSGC